VDTFSLHVNSIEALASQIRLPAFVREEPA
jgi:hypothetical protein